MEFQDERAGREELSKMSSGAVLAELVANSGMNPLMHEVLQAMVTKLNEVKTQYFRKPVASMPFGASAEHSAALARLHPELRELIFEVNESRSDAVFEGCRHLAVRRCLLQLLAADSAIVDDPYAHQILVSGVRIHEHSFVWRTQVPVLDVDSVAIESGKRNLAVVDIVRSGMNIMDSLSVAARSESAEMLVVAPYDPRMWKIIGGQQMSGSYTFEWMFRGRALTPGVVKPKFLPSRFFLDDKYQGWSLYIQPYGSSDAIRYTRAEFLALFAGRISDNAFHEIRITRNGFAEISYIFSPSRPSVPQVESVTALEMEKLVPVGCVEVPKVASTDLVKSLLPGRQYDLTSDEPCFVRASYMEKALQQFFTTRLGREVVPSMMRSLHANSARMVYNGAIVTAETMVDVETMVVVLERVVAGNSEAKAKLSALSSVAKLPPSARSIDYATAAVSWIAWRAVQSADLTQGFKNVVDYVSRASSLSGQSLVLEPGETVDTPPLKYGPPQSELDDDKVDLVDVVTSYAEDVFGGYDLPYTLTREDVHVDKADSFQLRMQMKSMLQVPVTIEEVQMVYDEQMFPGNSMIDPTMVQVMAETGDVKFIVDVQYFKASIPLMFSTLEGYTVIPSRLRTSVGADLMSSFRSLMSSMMKRTFNRPRPEAPGDRDKFVKAAVSEAIRRFGNKHSNVMRAHFALNPLTVSDNAIRMWAQRHSTSDVLAAATLIDQGPVDPSKYRLMPKDVPKPSMSLSAQGSVMVGQTIVFHSKDMISLTVGVFTLIVSRLLVLFDTNIRFAFGADENTSGQWADKYLHMGYVTEIDVPKFDKSQDWVCFSLILHVMEVCGCDPDLIKFWYKASDEATVFNATFNLVFRTMFGNRSGSAATLATNCIVLLFAYLNSFADLGIIALLVKGDDSVLVTKRPLTFEHEQYLYEWWGFTMKRVEKPGVVGFCSSFFVKDSNEKYKLVRDICRVIEKFGRALPVNKPASYFLDYYVSVVDTALAYEDPVVVANLQVATAKYYGKQVDVRTLVNFVRYISSSSQLFLKTLYGLTDLQLSEMRSIDDAVETIVRTRSTRFVKGKDVVDAHRSMRLTLVDKMKISTDWIFTD